MLTETSLTADQAPQTMLTTLGYMLLGLVKSPNGILPTPGLDHSTSPGGQTHLLFTSSSSLALWQAALQHHPPVRIKVHELLGMEVNFLLDLGSM